MGPTPVRRSRCWCDDPASRAPYVVGQGSIVDDWADGVKTYLMSGADSFRWSLFLFSNNKIIKIIERRFQDANKTLRHIDLEASCWRTAPRAALDV